ncbi:MAG: peptidylprolyl isomerase [Propionicimonas sp.]
MNRILAALAVPAVLLVGCTNPVPAESTRTMPYGTESPSAPVTTASQPPAAGTVACEYPAGGPAAREVQPPNGTDVPATGTAEATMTLNGKPVKITLDRAAAPCTVNSFVSLAQQGYFDGTTCHRVVDEGIFVLQCGDPSASGSGGPGYTIPDEFEAITGYPAGALAMANTGQPNSGGSQFFIVFAETPLPPQYTVFGSIDQAGIDLATEIAAGGNDGSFGQAGGGKPLLPAEIEKVTVG